MTVNVFGVLDDNETEKRYLFFCPGCKCGHFIRVRGPGPVWSFNEDLIKPTVNPSLLIRGTKPLTDDEHARWMAGEKLPQPVPEVCHSFIRDGQIQFLPDCTHALSGKTVPLEPL